MKPKCMALITSPLTRFSYDKENSKSPGCEKLGTVCLPFFFFLIHRALSSPCTTDFMSNINVRQL